MSKPVLISSPSQFASILSSSRIVVADFYADWCGPCKTIAPVYEQLAAQLSRPNTLTFTKINTDAQQQIAQTYNITAMPTFLLFKNGRETKRIRGADVKQLNEAVKALAKEAADPANDGASGSASGSSSGGVWMGAALPRGYSDITSSVEMQSLDFLNIDSAAGGARAVFAGEKPSALDGKSKKTEIKDYILSDTDAQMMLFVPFQASLKLHTLLITSVCPKSDGDEDDEDAPSRPKTLKLYSNRPTVLGFDEADSTQPTQEIEIKPSDWNEKTQTAKVELRFVKFQSLSSLVVFVVENESGGEVTRVDRIRCLGEVGEKRGGVIEKVGDDS